MHTKMTLKSSPAKTPKRPASKAGLVTRAHRGHSVDVAVAYAGPLSAVQERLRGGVSKRAVVIELQNKGMEERLLRLLAADDSLPEVTQLKQPAKDTPSPATQVRDIEARMQARLREALLSSGDYVPASKIAQWADFSASNPSAQPSKWKHAGRIFAIQDKGVDLYPAFALDESFRPRKAMKTVLDVFAGSKSSLALAAWFQSVNGRLKGRAPKDMLANQPDLVIEAAQIEAAGSLHG